MPNSEQVEAVPVQADVLAPLVGELKEAPPSGVMPGWFRPVLAIVVVVLGFASLAGIFWFSENRDQVAMVLIGSITGYVLAVVQFSFGTSVGSGNKDALTRQLLTSK